MITLLKRMQLSARLIGDSTISVVIPPTRSDILHACDIMEDVAVAYGFNNIVKTIPNTNTDGKQQPVNKLAELLRSEIAQMGYNEVVNFALCSRDENFSFLGLKDDDSAVTLANPKTIEFQVCRTSLIPGVLKTLSNSKNHPLPMKVFELQDIVIKNNTNDVGAGNIRNLSIAYCGLVSGFEIIHGALDRIFALLRIPVDVKKEGKKGYYILPFDSPTFFPKRCANIYLNGKNIGIMGIVHPNVLNNFELPFATSILEITIEPFVDL
jgi:phenylalanyl-tRNA synthetase beta chain